MGSSASFGGMAESRHTWIQYWIQCRYSRCRRHGAILSSAEEVSGVRVCHWFSFAVFELLGKVQTVVFTHSYVLLAQAICLRCWRYWLMAEHIEWSDLMKCTINRNISDAAHLFVNLKWNFSVCLCSMLNHTRAHTFTYANEGSNF